MTEGPAAIARSARSARRARLLVGIAIALVVFVGGELVLRDRARLVHAWADVLWTITSGFAAWRCLRTASTRPRPHQRAAWRWIAAGCAAWTLGMLVWDVYELAWGVVTPFPTIAELGFHALPIALAIGLFLLRGDAPSQHLTLKQAGDLGVVASAIAIASTLVLYAPARDNAESVAYIVAALAYPILGLGTFAFGLTTLWQHPRGGRRRIVAVLLAASAVLGAVTTFYAVSLLTRRYEAGSELDVFWILGFALVIWASSEEEWRDLEGEEHAIERVRVGDLLVPPIAVLVIAVLMVIFRDRYRPELALPLGGLASLLAISSALREWGVHRIERALRLEARREEAEHRRLLESVPIGIAEIDANGRVVASNARFDAMIGALGRDLRAPGYQESGIDALVARALARRERATSEEPLRLGGRVIRCAVSPGASPGESPGEPGAVVVIEDVTEEQRLQSELLQSQKMQAVGALAGGIAHDFNNLLSGMIASVTVLRKRGGTDSESGVFLDHMEQSMWRAAELTRRLLAISRRRDPVKTVVDAGAAVERVAALLARSVDENIVVRVELPAERVAITGDPGQLEQALLNLGINARDAMRPKGGELRFACALEEAPEGGMRLAIRVRDGGRGIAAAVRDRIFEPFFTTKDEGEGTGLGLAMVYAFARDHGGAIDVESEIGRGSTFTLRLPVADVALPEHPSEERSKESPRGTETVLVVDDRDTALFAMKAILVDLGYTVVVAGNGVEALAEIERRKGGVDLVVTDAMMRRMGGRDLLVAMRRRGMSMPAILATGHDADAHRGVEGFAAILRKPFDPLETARTVRDVLDGKRVGAKIALEGEPPDRTSEDERVKVG